MESTGYGYTIISLRSDVSCTDMLLTLPWFIPGRPPRRKVTPPAPLKFNALDGKVDRQSHMGDYEIVDGVPRSAELCDEIHRFVLSLCSGWLHAGIPLVGQG